MKKLLYAFCSLLVMLFLEGVTEKVAQLPNKSRIIYFAHARENPTPKEFLHSIQERYYAAAYTNDIFVVPSTKYVVNGKLSHSLDIRTLGTIRFKYQVFPRRYYMDYNPIGFMLYISDRDWNEYYGGVVLTKVTPEMLGCKINPFGHFRDFQIALPQWVNHISQMSDGQINPIVSIEHPEELEILSDSYIAPYLYLQTGDRGVVSTKSVGLVDAAKKMDFYSFPFSISVNGRVICKTVAELYDDRFLSNFNDAIFRVDRTNRLGKENQP